MELAAGTYSGDAGSLGVDVHGGNLIQVLQMVSGTNWAGPGNLLNAAVVGDSVSFGSPAAFEAAGVPEPAGAMVVTAAGVLGLARRRRRKEGHR